MEELSTMMTQDDYEQAVGLDLGDRFSYLVFLDASGEPQEQTKIRTTPEAMRARFEGVGRLRIALEVGSHSPWVARLLQELGHEVIVANPRKIPLIGESLEKTDQRDAELLARLARFDPSLLSPVEHRSAELQASLAVVRAREVAVHTRTRIVNHLRSVVKSSGGRLPSCSTSALASQAKESIPESLRPALEPLLDLLVELNQKIRDYDRRVEHLGKTSFPETGVLRQVDGVGALTSLVYVLILGNPERFRRSRDVGPFVGLVPARRASGDRDPQLRISKAGDELLRRLLVGSAHYILGPFGPDSDLKRFGQRLVDRGGRYAKKRAVVAVARKLAVLLHHLWRTGAVYEPLYQAQRSADAA